MKTILNNAKIYTMNDFEEIASTMAFQDEIINYVGCDNVIPYDDKVRYIDMKGKTIMPGIIDSHTHPGMTSQSSWHIKLPKTDN